MRYEKMSKLEIFSDVSIYSIETSDNLIEVPLDIKNVTVLTHVNGIISLSIIS